MVRAGLVAFVMVTFGCTADPRPSAAGGLVDAGDAGHVGDASDAEAGLPDATDAEAGAPVGGYELASFPDGFDDGFGLPPGFAPFLPLTGAEVTREPPGMYEPTSDHYFSYVVLWWLTGEPSLETSSLRDYLFIYYTGLCGGATVTLEEPAESRANDAGVGLERAGTLSVDYCFGGAVPPARIEVSTFDCPDHDAVLTLVSPEDETGAAWDELRALRSSFRCW